MTYQYPPATIDMLREHCDQKYAVFTSYLHLGINDQYCQFKLDLKNDMDYLIDKIGSSIDEKVTLGLLHHLNRQLNFIYHNESVCQPKDMAEFMEVNYPYKEKVNEVIEKYSGLQQNEEKSTKKNKLK